MKKINSSKNTVSPAGNWVRFYSSLIDLLVIGVLWSILYLLYYFLSPLLHIHISEEAQLCIIIISTASIVLFYRIYFTVTKGATIGKDLFGLAVYKDKSDSKINYKSGSLRESILFFIPAIPLIGNIFWFINLLVILFRKKGIHDRIAHTRVVKANPTWPIQKQIFTFVGLFIIITTLIGLYSYIGLKIFYPKFEPIRKAEDIIANNQLIKHRYSPTDREEENNIRRNDLNKLMDAIYKFRKDRGVFPNYISNTPKEIKRSEADLCSLLTPKYIPNLPSDPSLMIDGYKKIDCKSNYETGYFIMIDEKNVITVSAPLATEEDVSISR